MKDKPTCQAKTRAGTPCKRSPALGKRRCRMHGGAPGSGGPLGQRNGRYTHGRYARTAEERRARLATKGLREWLKLLKPEFEPYG